MNRTVVIGGVVAVAVLLGVAAWLLIGGRSGTSSSQHVAGEDQGPVSLNPVEVITDHGANESPDGRTLTITFPKFELNAKTGETASAVFSTTWRMKLAPDERALVAVASLSGYMKSTATPAPAAAPVAEPTTPAQPAATTPPTDGTTPPAEQPATPAAPATPAPAKPVAGDGLARVVVMLGNETTVTEWFDVTGNGGDHKLSKAVAFVGAPVDMRNGSTVPVTVTVELSGASSAETLAKINGIDLKLFAESAPLPEPTVEPSAATPPADATTAPATTDATTPPADSTTPAPTTPATP